MTLERKRARLSAGELAYADEGDGPPVVLLHGFPTSSHLWRDLVPLLAPRFRAVAPDLLGYGDSDKPPAGSLDVRTQAGLVAELLELLGIDEFAAVGHGVGGGVAQLLALDGGVAVLVLVDSASLDEWPVVRLLSPAPRVDAKAAEAAVRRAFERGMANRERLAEEDLEEYLRPWRADPPALFRAAHQLGALEVGEVRDRLAALEVPALLIWGEEDADHPTEVAERLWETLPDAAIALLPGCSHFVTEDAPETVVPLISQFLRTRYLKEPAHSHRHGGPVRVDLGASFERPLGPDEPEGLDG